MFFMNIKLGLERTLELLQQLDNPHTKLKFVHIAGTNGKGSTAAMIANTCVCAGLKTGLFTSPYIHQPGEMISVNFEQIKQAQLDEIISKITIDHKDPATEFEIFVAAAMKYFYDQSCDIVVLEVGMGGRLDATNVIDTPEAAVITAIGLDHMDFLGETVELIAAEKAGIIKPGGACVSYPQNPGVARVIAEKCQENNAELRLVQDPETTLKIPLLGEHQKYNAAVAHATLKVLQEKGFAITNDHIKSGLATTKWGGRFEILQKNPVFVLDGAHNAQAVQVVINTISENYPGKKVRFLFGTLADKDWQDMAGIILSKASKIHTITPDSPRALRANELAQYIRSMGGKATAHTSTKDGVQEVLQNVQADEIICALGSLYNFEQIRSALFLK